MMGRIRFGGRSLRASRGGYRPAAPSGQIRLDGRAAPMPARWAELSLGQLRRVAWCALRGMDGTELALRVGLALMNLRPLRPAGRWQSAPGAPLWIRKPNGARRALDAFAARDIAQSVAWLFREGDPGRGLDPRLEANPVAPPRGLRGWEPHLGDVRLDEFLLMMDALAELPPAGAPWGARDRFLFALYRPPDTSGARRPVACHTPRLGARIGRRFAPLDAQIALWWAQGLLARLAARFPHVLGAHGSEAPADQPQRPSHLVYALARGNLAELPQIRAAYALDTLTLLEAGARRALS